MHQINVASYSNGDRSHTPVESDYMYKVYIGMKWQCVEFARRWLFLRKGCVSPRNETLLIYEASRENGVYRHVAVIVDVLPNSIRIAEQNYNTNYWTGNYSRELPFVLKDGLYYIEDRMPILGWMELNDHNQIKPLNQQTINQIIKLNGTSPDFICHNSF